MSHSFILTELGPHRPGLKTGGRRLRWSYWWLSCLLVELCTRTYSWGVEPAATPAPSLMAKIRISQDRRGFVTDTGKPFNPVGVTYYRPGTGWAPQVWKEWDAPATRSDLIKLEELGANCVRVFLSFGSFYQQPGVLDASALEKFDQFLAIAEQTGLYVHPTGPDHWEGVPAWAKGDRYAEERLLAAIEQYWSLFAQRYQGRSVIFAYDLLNEPQIAWDTPALRGKWNQWLVRQYGSAEKAALAWGMAQEELSWPQVAVPEPKDTTPQKYLLDYQHFREQIADEWVRRQVTAIKTADPDALVTVGYIQWSVPALLPGLNHYSAFQPERQAAMLDFLEIHFYPLARGFYEYGQEDETRNLAYLESVVREVARCQKPVVLAEFGWYGGGKLTINQGKHPLATEADQARWCRRAVETTAGLAVGWLNWGFYDHPQARDVSQLTGLLTVEGQPKAWGNEFKKLANQYHQKLIPPRVLGPRPTLDWDACITRLSEAQAFREEYLRAYRKD